jgi:two-component system, LytTR family, response regulator LytT
VTVAIVEDEPAVARRLERLTRDILGDRLRAVAVHRTLAAAQEALRTSPIDILILDLNVAGHDGFDLLHEAIAESFHTIVVSASAERAIEAYALGVLDFVAKPFNRERLATAFERVSLRAGTAASIRVLAVRKRHGLALIPVEHVLFIKGAGSYTELHLRDGSVELHSKTLEQLEAILPFDFERTHKSYIVRLSEIARIQAHEGTQYDLELRSGASLPVGRTRYPRLLSRLGR